MSRRSPLTAEEKKLIQEFVNDESLQCPAESYRAPDALDEKPCRDNDEFFLHNEGKMVCCRAHAAEAAAATMKGKRRADEMETQGVPSTKRARGEEEMKPATIRGTEYQPEEHFATLEDIEAAASDALQLGYNPELRNLQTFALSQEHKREVVRQRKQVEDDAEYTQKTLDSLENLMGKKVSEVKSCNGSKWSRGNNTVCVTMDNQSVLYPIQKHQSVIWEEFPLNKHNIPAGSGADAAPVMQRLLQGSTLFKYGVDVKTGLMHVFFKAPDNTVIEFQAKDYEVVPNVLACERKLIGRRVVDTGKIIAAKRFPGSPTWRIKLDAGDVLIFPTEMNRMIMWKATRYGSLKPEEVKNWEDQEKFWAPILAGAVLTEIREHEQDDLVSIIFKTVSGEFVEFEARDWELINLKPNKKEGPLFCNPELDIAIRKFARSKLPRTFRPGKRTEYSTDVVLGDI